MYTNTSNDELEPRPAPKPTQFQELLAKPEVPELSVVFDSSENNSKPLNRHPPYYTNSPSSHETYSEWKNRQNRSPPVHKETRYYEPRDKQYYGSSSYSDCENPYSRFSDKISYKSGSDYHKCACQNTPTVKDIYNMMQLQNDQMKFLLETIQKLLVTVLSNQQNQHKCSCSENGHCKRDNDSKTTEVLKKDVIQKELNSQHSKDNNTEKPQTNLKKTEIVQKKNELNKNLKCSGKQDVTSVTKEKEKNPVNTICNNDNDEKDNKKEKERTYSIISDESFDLNANDVQVIEDPISPEQSIHIDMKSSSEDSENSECEEENDKKIEVGWTMYKNIIGQVNNLLEDNMSDRKSDVAEPVERVKHIATTTPKNFEPYKHFMLPENSKIDSSLQMQALAMQYLSPEQAVKFDMNKHFVPTKQPTTKSPNNYSISTLHYMERYHLIAPEKNYTSENSHQKLPTEGLLNKKKKSLRKNKTPSKILNITELKQQPKLS
ncbi:uncharacterized protein LOC100167866 isoform X1 [Acyrthosiphon pisum]|uniref:Uncharacterized protein n=2 Tax=Acyrthosiphon pisum TaxID=7029 RepID=A0A8R2NVB2_ACYPI|nr:uncharacterized protein LOC100167866 isoform X1 [Acyrthosiphon pisum]|eukprot:XP_001943505.2 PREDICTED: uncharacterized protein LOC100167866 [Acyrthosiphon pisum]